MANIETNASRRTLPVPPEFAADEWQVITESLHVPRQAQVLGLVIQSHKDQEIVNC